MRLIQLTFLLAGISSALGQVKISANLDLQSVDYGSFYLVGYAGKDSIQWHEVFSVSVEGSRLQMLGDYSFENERLSFKPKYLPDPLVVYIATFTDIDGQESSDRFTFPSIDSGKTSVAFSPNSETVPANMLRGYLYFTKPMSLQNPYEFIKLHDEQGEEIKDAFVEVKQGLWNHNRTRLTLLFHPGRIKQGVGPNIEQGAIFKEGKKYRLRLSKEWKNDLGVNLGEGVEIDIQVGAEVREKMDVTNWTIEASKDGIRLWTKELLDIELVDRSLLVNNDQYVIGGEWVYSGEYWDFAPAIEMKKGQYALMVLSRLEDVCGNTVSSAFDQKHKLKAFSKSPVKLLFEVK